MNTITLDNVSVTDFNKFVGGSIFTAKFVKKDGTVRIMNCRREVKKHLQGGKSTWQPEKRGYVSVYDLQAEGYRVINLSTLIELKANGKVLTNNAMSRKANLEKIAELANLIAQLDGDYAPITQALADLSNTMATKKAIANIDAIMQATKGKATRPTGTNLPQAAGRKPLAEYTDGRNDLEESIDALYDNTPSKVYVEVYTGPVQ